MSVAVPDSNESPKPRTVLVVEDEVLIRWMVCEELRLAGMRAIEAKNAHEAISILETAAEIDLVFTDVRMPGGMDGLRLSALIRERWPSLRIIIGSAEFLQPATLAVADAFVQKPYNVERLIVEVRSVLGDEHEHQNKTGKQH
ncbi:MAG: response regulator [Geminicoccaceae bacterium]